MEKVCELMLKSVALCARAKKCDRLRPLAIICSNFFKVLVDYLNLLVSVLPHHQARVTRTKERDMATKGRAVSGSVALLTFNQGKGSSKKQQP